MRDRLLRLDDNGRHCRGRCQRRHFGVHHADVGSGSGGFRDGAGRRR